MNPVEARLAALEARLAAVESRLANGGGAQASGSGAPVVADDADLDSQFGDPIVKKDPPRWIEEGGESYAGCKMSECPSNYLRAVAGLFDWQAGKDEEQNKTYIDKKTGKPRATAPFKRKDAARARGHALRNANKTAAPMQPATPASSGEFNYGAASSSADDSEIPF